MKTRNKKRIIMVSICVMLCVAIGSVIYGLNKKPAMTAEQVIAKMQEAGLPIDSIIVYNEQTDENKLLGRPNQYTSKINFADTRLEQYDVEKNPNGGTIEVFNNSSDLNKRKAHNDEVMKKFPAFTEYLFVNDNYIIRLSYDLTNEQAEEYKKIFESIK